MHARIRFLLFMLAVALTPAVGGAQNSTTVPAGPRTDAIVTGFRVSEQHANTSASAQRRQSRPVALMIVGGAAVVLGALIGGDVGLLFMIGGAVALLIGLYRYLQ